ncbi:hypothetical protein ATZ33_17160 [Enterococcus silesiacus]|uniref:Pr6Pr family membrane protein n=1 Tax=Enterococcus silesiacus TaxID=332949 RepID=A0A0S3KFI3_9ENTE|nr:Pr6Pr family membrane protein [Enterococcus silesiacus]ALS03045.1 hypothetical protein ATZ33_17160 [Enterococcus silesiacus]OJG92989.1 hypothetical protein RV15_GL002123 [Enterococcus silesiacus]
MKQKIITISRFILALLITLGLLERLGIFNGEIDLTMFVYYTNLSNVLVLIVSGYTAYKMLQAIIKNENFSMSSRLEKLRIATTVIIVITGLVYHFVLYPQYRSEDPYYNWFTFYNIISHYVAPIAMFVDWLFFDQKIKLNVSDPIKWLSIPIIYIGYALIYGLVGPIIPKIGTSYVYFFFDIDKKGITGVFSWVVILLIFFLVLNYLIYFLNNSLAKRQQSSKKV